MVKINRVYTGGGDGGESSLVDGSRRKNQMHALTWLGFATKSTAGWA